MDPDVCKSVTQQQSSFTCHMVNLDFISTSFTQCLVDEAEEIRSQTTSGISKLAFGTLLRMLKFEYPINTME